MEISVQGKKLTELLRGLLPLRLPSQQRQEVIPDSFAERLTGDAISGEWIIDGHNVDTGLLSAQS